MRIIPAIDIIEGKCVRLSQGNYSTQIIYNENPVEVALEFEANGMEYLHVVDLDGAKSGGIINYKMLEKIATATRLKIDFGGGIKSRNDARIAFECGASQITGGSIALTNQALFADLLRDYGNKAIILGADVRNRKIATHGWLENSKTDVIDFITFWENAGVKYTICTDVAKDGLLQGPSSALYSEILDKTNISLIASGGVSGMQDLYSLKALGCDGAIVGKALYEGKITSRELQKFILQY